MRVERPATSNSVVSLFLACTIYTFKMVASLNARVQKVLSKSYMLTFVTTVRTLFVASEYLTAAFVEGDWDCLV